MLRKWYCCFCTIFLLLLTSTLLHLDRVSLPLTSALIIFWMCHFFNAVFDTLFPSSVSVNKENLSNAQKFIQKSQANMGSTDLWKPLHSLQLLSSVNDGSGSINANNTLPPKSVFVVSDGHMTEEMPTLTAIRDGLKTSRIFTFGVR